MRVETHVLGNFFDAQVGVAQERLDFHDDHGGDPLSCGASAHGFHRLCEIFRTDVELVGIPCHFAFVHIVERKELHEVVEYAVGACVVDFGTWRTRFEHATYIEVEHLKNGLRELLSQAFLGEVEAVLEQLVVVPNHGALIFGESDHRMMDEIDEIGP